jgi:branched-subunit amino acid transport protein
MSVWLGVLAVGAITLAVRLLPLLTVERLAPGPRAVDALRHAGAGAVTALVLLAVLDAPRMHAVQAGTLAAVALGVLVAWRRRSMVVVVLAGGCAYALVTGLAAALGG